MQVIIGQLPSGRKVEFRRDKYQCAAITLVIAAKCIAVVKLYRRVAAQ